MSKRLQVLLTDEEYEALQQVSQEAGQTVSEWVRGVLRRARLDRSLKDKEKKLAAVRAALRHSFPAPAIDKMLEEIEVGYLG